MVAKIKFIHMGQLFPLFVYLLIILLSKELIVFNEEILVVLAFFTFIYLVIQNASNIISSELDEKSTAIKNKFDVYNTIQEKTIIYLCDYYTKREFLAKKIQDGNKTKLSRLGILNNHIQVGLVKETKSSVEEILIRFILNQNFANSIFQNRFGVKVELMRSKII